ncbi:MAG: NAD(P)H:quinone oxidoreductase [Acidobacteria bacterium]|nr:NAD(P)H:quinone oxidoreductase [Acidobacteriota bacterium]
MKIYVIFYSRYGHVHQMAKAAAEGAREVEGAEAFLFQVPEIHPHTNAIPDVALIEPAQLAEADAILFGTPTRFGNMAAPMRHFLDQTGGLWMKGALIGKPAGVFCSTATQHGGQESTILSFHTTLLHHGMVVVGMPYSEARQTTMAEISGGSPYGATTIAAGDGSRQPSENELAMARFQGRHLAAIAKKLSA